MNITPSSHERQKVDLIKEVLNRSPEKPTQMAPAYFIQEGVA